ncbi:PREDICTED: uncharacterized protein LOC109188136 [Ipomoea nil]|uniref:uncharacterized protein LOC109188136 n=1 Tax=Ipomoea nil TaxID=35883 RepID=UPI0009016EA4|nr:PREDICTED: uncharacterized protein LOC109188136 [Ipomoea nil]
MHVSYYRGEVMKTRGKGKIFKCLRPATNDDGYFKHSASCDSFDLSEYSSPVSEHRGGRGGDGAIAAGDPKILRNLSMRKPAAYADQSSDVDASAPPDDPNVGKRKFRGKFRRVLKAVFFEASLVRKLRKTDALMGPFRSRSTNNLSSSSSRSTNNLSSSKSQRISISESFSSRELAESSDKFSRIYSDSCSSRLSTSSLMTAREFSSSPCSSSVPCCSPACCLDRNRSISSSSRTKQKQKLERGRYCWKVGWCCLILCLLALMFWGKTLAIVFMSAWLYFAPLCFKSAIDPPPLFEPSECMITSRSRPRHARRHSTSEF